MAEETKQTTKRGSIIVIVVLLALAVAGFMATQCAQPAATSEYYAKVTVYGEVVDLLPLNINTRQVYVTDDGTNTVVVEDGFVHIEDANCAGGDCMKQGEINKTYQLLVCLPHQLIVEIVPADGTNTPSVYTGNEAVGAEGSSNIDIVAR